VLVASLSSAAADRKTLELVAESGPAPADHDSLFATLRPHPAGALDGVLDTDNMPLAEDPGEVQQELPAVRAG
jgi:hypothetical protein